MIPKLSLRDWLVNLLEIPCKDDELIERSICAKCKWREVSRLDSPCSDCSFDIGNWEFDDENM